MTTLDLVPAAQMHFQKPLPHECVNSMLAQNGLFHPNVSLITQETPSGVCITGVALNEVSESTLAAAENFLQQASMVIDRASAYESTSQGFAPDL